MRIALKNTTIDKYFGFLTKLDNISKKRLIVKLTESIEVKEKKHLDLKNLYGAWEDTRTSDEIINEIRNSVLGTTSIYKIQTGVLIMVTFLLFSSFISVKQDSVFPVPGTPTNKYLNISLLFS
jgi:hypothetical protein